ncbi:MAG: shikimate kinase [Christensenellaceae bacterium]|nr:shikimate kinase [Christensenellaceae bacterium]
MKKIYGLVGRKLGHSFSPEIHKKYGLDDYRLFELEPEEIGAFLKRQDIGALNVTIPYKREVMKYCTHISDEARTIGSVNTIVRRNDGTLLGYNTDFFGLIATAEHAGISFKNKKVMILGSGGASLTAKAAAAAKGAASVVVISRSGENNYDNISRHYDAQVIINATPVGMYPNVDDSIIDLTPFKELEGVIDVIYNPLKTRILMQAEKLGVRCSNGLYMLAAQAKAGEELFFDKSIPDAELDKVFDSILKDMQNIVLIGMPGCGKNTVGEALAKISGKDIVDIDKEIVRTAGMPIETIFEKYGETEFRRLEHEETKKAGKMNGKIIITGGGIVKDENNYIPLNMNGRIYHIERDIDLLSRSGRPLSKNADLNAMYNERLPMYMSFRDEVIFNDSTPEETALKIWRDFIENTGN